MKSKEETRENSKTKPTKKQDYKRDKSLQEILQEIMKYTDIRNYKTGRWEETDEDTRDLVFVEEKLKENDINTKFVERLRRI